MPKLKRVILVNRQRKLKVNSPAIRQLATSLLEGEGIDEDCAVEIVFLRDSPMADLNASFRQRSGPTDVLSFAADLAGWPTDEPKLLGTVVISVDRASAQAVERDLPIDEEIERLVVHGLLHLCGFTHDEKSDSARMSRRERLYLNIPNREEVR